MKIAATVSRFFRDSVGSVLVEVTVVLPILIFFIFGSIDFLFAFYEWNAATRAVQVGARIAAVSTPVAGNLDSMSAAFVSATLRPGSAMPSFTITCDGSTEKCQCEGTCLGGAVVYNAAAMNTIVYGRGSSACGDATSSYAVGMCDVFNRISPANVRIEYRQPAAPAGLGYVGRPGGPVPTITVSLQNIPFRFFFLGMLFKNAKIPALATTMTAEDLSSCSPTVVACDLTR
jgi:Flp pilus assembly protein TadG